VKTPLATTYNGLLLLFDGLSLDSFGFGNHPRGGSVERRIPIVHVLLIVLTAAA
jgi:hypothetical protein